LGAFGYAVSRAALERVCRLKDGKDTEIWGGYFTQIPGFRWGTLIFNSSSPLHWPDLRVTVDTAEDFEFVQGLFQTLHQPGEIFGIDQVIALCRREKNRTSLNSHVVQRAAPSISLRKPCTS
jgi:spore coat polysaccharide biosynthesis protein SpsF (cytidylyltransferase family)